ncbi:MAG: site-specific DNA-methyltransferase [Myxococcota bacterium]
MVELAFDRGTIPLAVPAELVPHSVASPPIDQPMATLIEGDNLSALEALVEEGRRFELIYLDPPFFTQRIHHPKKRARRRDGAVVPDKSTAFDDRWASLDAYLGHLWARLERIRALLSEDGSVVLHVDPTTSHYLKVVCDTLFGRGAFASEIIWRYRRWPAKTRNFQRVHDVLLRYVRDPRVTPRFRQLYEPLAPSTLATWGNAKQRAVVDAEGRRRRSSKTDDASPGTPMGDVWDIGVVAPVARERTGYPTQKPEALLRRIVTALSREGDAVLDPYVGSGTTLAVTAALGRTGVGIDKSPEAIAVTRERLREAGIHVAEPRLVVRPSPK